MSTRFRNNLIALCIVFVFLVGVAKAADPIVTDSTSVVTSTGTQTTNS